MICGPRMSVTTRSSSSYLPFYGALHRAACGQPDSSDQRHRRFSGEHHDGGRVGGTVSPRRPMLLPSAWMPESSASVRAESSMATVAMAAEPLLELAPDRLAL